MFRISYQVIPNSENVTLVTACARNTLAFERTRHRLSFLVDPVELA